MKRSLPVSRGMLHVAVLVCLSWGAVAQAQWHSSGSSYYGSGSSHGTHISATPVIVLTTPIESSLDTYSRRKNYSMMGDFSMFTPQAQDEGDEYDEEDALVQAGDVLAGKLKSVPIYANPSKKSRVVARLGRSDDAVYMGEEVQGWYRVSTDHGEGWADKLLLLRR